MIKKLSYLLFLSVVLLTLGCATSYKPINPSNLNLRTEIEDENFIFNYEYDVLQQSGNKRYSKKELRNNLKIIAIKIYNKTDNIISVSEDIGFYVNNQEVNLLNPSQITQNMNQNTISYLFYLLLTPVKLITTSSDGSVNSFPIGYGVGPGLTALNMLISSSANSSLKEELVTYDIVGKSIPSGETLSGIMIVRDIGYEPITIRLKDKL